VAREVTVINLYDHILVDNDRAAVFALFRAGVAHLAIRLLSAGRLTFKSHRTPAARWSAGITSGDQENRDEQSLAFHHSLLTKALSFEPSNKFDIRASSLSK
jgi:hypothetical protein